MWYGPLLLVPLSVCFHPFSGSMYLCIIFLLQVEVPLPTTGGSLEEEVITAPSGVFPSVGEEPPNGGMAEEVGQPMLGIQPILSVVPLAT